MQCVEELMREVYYIYSECVGDANNEADAALMCVF